MVFFGINIKAYNRENAQTDFVRASNLRANFAVNLHPIQLLHGHSLLSIFDLAVSFYFW